MFILNFKVNGSRFSKIIFTIMILIILIILCIGIYNIFIRNRINGNYVINTSYNISHDQVIEINPNNYTNILKAANENIDDYVGCKIHLSGYIYRLIDFNENQFVIARDMIVTPDKQSLVVGFLSEYNNAKDFEDGIWVEATGEIIKGSFKGDIAILKVREIKKVEKPKDEYVYPPDDTYIPTKNS